MDNKKISFPEDFLWGAATSAHQVEGGTHNDWSEWEHANSARLAKEAFGRWEKWQQKKFPEMLGADNYISGMACDHYNRFGEDFDIAQELGHNAHRFSIEWSRIEPREGEFSQEALEHYKKVVDGLHKRGMEPFVTLWHWTLPLWLSKKGGIANKHFPFYFERYVAFVAGGLGDGVHFWITINEPGSVVPNGYFKGTWPPQKKNVFLMIRTFLILARAHKKAYAVLHTINSETQVGFATIASFFEAGNIFLKPVAALLNYFSNRWFFNRTGKYNDFIALQYYFHNRLGGNENKKVSDMGWEIYPEGLCWVIKEFIRYKKPIYITENGLADAGDSRRADFIRDHIYWLGRAMQEGADVRGYFYWSLLDNFEWDKGFWPRFGLVAVDFKTQKRTVRKSAFVYKKIIEKNGLFL